MGIFDPHDPVRKLEATWRARAREEDNDLERERRMRQGSPRGGKLGRWLGWLFIAVVLFGLAYVLLG